MSTKRALLKTFQMIKKKMYDFEWRKLLRISSLSSIPLCNFVYGVNVAPMFLIFSFLPSALADGFAQFAQSHYSKLFVLISPVLNLPGENEGRSKKKKGANVSLWTVVIFLIPKILSSRMLGQLTANTV